MYVFSARVVGICRSWSESAWFISAEIKRYFCFGDFSPWGRIRRFICIDSLLLPESRVFISDNLEDNLVLELTYIACLCIFLSTNHLHLRLGSGFPVIISENCWTRIYNFLAADKQFLGVCRSFRQVIRCLGFSLKSPLFRSCCFVYLFIRVGFFSDNLL